MKLSISMDDELVKRADAYAKANFLTRSGFIGLAVNQYLGAVEGREVLAKMADAFKSLAATAQATGTVDADALKEIEMMRNVLASMAG